MPLPRWKALFAEAVGLSTPGCQNSVGPTAKNIWCRMHSSLILCVPKDGLNRMNCCGGYVSFSDVILLVSEYVLILSYLAP